MSSSKDVSPAFIQAVKTEIKRLEDRRRWYDFEIDRLQQLITTAPKRTGKKTITVPPITVREAQKEEILRFFRTHKAKRGYRMQQITANVSLDGDTTYTRVKTLVDEGKIICVTPEKKHHRQYSLAPDKPELASKLTGPQIKATRKLRKKGEPLRLIRKFLESHEEFVYTDMSTATGLSKDHIQQMFSGNTEGNMSVPDNWYTEITLVPNPHGQGTVKQFKSNLYRGTQIYPGSLTSPR